tara:strand:+ start:391 stop:645 length:255 start_codon:yes stop_codon:yes gene_type:complete
MLSEKIIKKMKSNCVDVWQWNDSPKNPESREIYELFTKIYVLLSIILESVDAEDNEREIRAYEHKEGQDWLDFLPYNYKNKNNE